jgi:hypothetical protein
MMSLNREKIVIWCILSTRQRPDGDSFASAVPSFFGAWNFANLLNLFGLIFCSWISVIAL